MRRPSSTPTATWPKMPIRESSRGTEKRIGPPRAPMWRPQCASPTGYRCGDPLITLLGHVFPHTAIPTTCFLIRQIKMKLRIAIALAVCVAAASWAPADQTIQLDGSAGGKRFDGMGASAAAEPLRSCSRIIPSPSEARYSTCSSSRSSERRCRRCMWKSPAMGIQRRGPNQATCTSETMKMTAGVTNGG